MIHNIEISNLILNSDLLINFNIFTSININAILLFYYTNISVMRVKRLWKN